MITAFRPRCGDRCLKISDLEGKRVAIWGYGREGRAALAALRWRLPRQEITVCCSDPESASLRAMEDPNLVVDTDTVDGTRLSAFEVVIKSPGISPYTSPAVDAALHGTKFIGGTALWLVEGEWPDSTIRSWGDALWLSLTTMTTVGYGDHVPVTVSVTAPG